MRSGKSYEVVSEVIVPAIRSGRRVVTNVDGISQEKIHAYLKAKNPSDDHTKYGLVVHVDNGQVFLSDFFPYYDDEKSAHTDTIVQPGDLVCIDEAWRFWGASDCKLHKHHKSFFLEHGHFTHPVTKVACDLVLMIQDMSTLNRFVKKVVAFNFRTHKKVALGMGNTYSLNMWEGEKQTKATLIGTWVRRYKKDVFPLYQSFKGGAEGVMVNADRRQNIFTNKKLWLYVVLLFGGAGLASHNIWKFFHPRATGKDGKAQVVSVSASTLNLSPDSAVSNVVAKSGVVSSDAPPMSDEWRISGSYRAHGVDWTVLTNSAGAVRVASASQFYDAGIAQVGLIEGRRVTQWSGGSNRSSPSFGAAPPALNSSGAAATK
jgi:zona occludens toxin